ncbi:hypothetical protein [uncultured Bifidobacterium sp.]|uniref:hypothetical protein n=1 Tax=uncultured Bifidobacterium sp. TaxID=165187 RepID=UPI00263636F4|nr:hypothetical protein [uncultured Bifidobacterium sp.]
MAGKTRKKRVLTTLTGSTLGALLVGILIDPDNWTKAAAYLKDEHVPERLNGLGKTVMSQAKTLIASLPRATMPTPTVVKRLDAVDSLIQTHREEFEASGRLDSWREALASIRTAAQLAGTTMRGSMRRSNLRDLDSRMKSLVADMYDVITTSSKKD